MGLIQPVNKYTNAIIIPQHMRSVEPKMYTGWLQRGQSWNREYRRMMLKDKRFVNYQHSKNGKHPEIPNEKPNAMPVHAHESMAMVILEKKTLSQMLNAKGTNFLKPFLKDLGFKVDKKNFAKIKKYENDKYVEYNQEYC